jgi:hypothetical protein
MSQFHERRVIEGPVGAIEVALDWPTQWGPAHLGEQPVPRAAFIGHPHPLYGGTLDNKVAATLARAFQSSGWLAVRPNFRGVGASAGEHDHGHGETEDFLHLIDTLPQWLGRPLAPGYARALAGFSFGSFVVAKAAGALAERGTPPQHLVLVGTAAGKWPVPRVSIAPLVIHGELDDTIPLADVFEWARPQEIPVVVLPGADHFFHRRLSTVKRLVTEHIERSEHGTTAAHEGGSARSAGAAQ